MWEYQECIEAFNEDFLEYKRQDNMSNSEALARTFDEYYSPNIEDEMEKALINVLYVETVSEKARIFIIAKENRIKELKSIDFQKIEKQIEKKQITKNQLEELIIRREKALERLEKIPVDYCPRARWYYEEIVNEVYQYLTISVKSEQSSEAIVSNVLERFKRDCKNTLSEKMAIYTTLGEYLVKQNLIIPKGVIKELSQFNVNETEEQLLLKEKQDLELRIHKLLESN
ncbi:Imm3 family immunity protein [Bacillus sp. FJAT-51639]|uniref:Imm3 family immunity protein n=1 Tax=Bacillus bruguierae TaxID=3127667 RepID=A0ABU8FND8_9BACI